MDFTLVLVRSLAGNGGRAPSVGDAASLPTNDPLLPVTSLLLSLALSTTSWVPEADPFACG